MEVIDVSGKDGMCLKCHRELSASEKKSMVPICIKCIIGLADVIKDGISGDDLREFSDDVNNFSSFISSSANLMGLDDIVVIQVCFNIYMEWVGEMARGNPNVAKKIFKDSKRFIEIELERLEDAGEDDLDRGSIGDLFEKILDNICAIKKDNNKSNLKNGNVDGEKCSSGGDNVGSDKDNNEGGNKKNDIGQKEDGNKCEKEKCDIGEGKRIRIE